MLRSIAKHTLRMAPRVEAAVVTQRGMSLQGTKGYPDKERAEEAVFFHKEDEKLLKDLLKKVRAQAEAQDPHAATGSRAAEQSALEAIVGSKLTEAEKQAVLDWKLKHY